MSARTGPDLRTAIEDESVDVLRQAVVSQAHAEAEEIIDEAEAETRDILREARREAEGDRAALLQKARRKADTLRAEAVGEAEIAAHQLQLKKREQLIDRVFQDARDQLASAVTWPDHWDILHRLTREALQHLGADEAVIRFDAQTQKVRSDELSTLLRTLEEELEVELSLGEPLQDRTGVVVMTADEHRRYDNSLQTRLRRTEPDLRAPVYHILVKRPS